MISRSPAQGIRITSEPGHARGPNPRYLNDDDDDDDDDINNNNRIRIFSTANIKDHHWTRS
jgi:hypothetical protein